MAEPGHLVLVGMMGSGKTSAGRQVAAALGRPFVDSDEQVEAATGRTVREIFETDGEPAYRVREREALVSALDGEEPSVVAAAGGVVVGAGDREALRRGATVVWLRARPEVLASRVTRGDHRPLLADDPLGTLTRLTEERRHLYEEVAHHVVDVDEMTSADVAACIVELVPG